MSLKTHPAQRVLKTEPGKLGVAPISLETAEDLKRAARALQEEARRRAEAMITPEERVALAAQKEQEAIEREQRIRKKVARSGHSLRSLIG